jgi:transcriptional regulator with XRE-family HTH domain
MGNLTIAQKKEWAKLLFLRENLTQKEIAERVGVSAVTINKWVKNERWEDLRVSITITKEEQIKNLYRQLAEINNAIAERDGNKFATPAEADTITKLANAIEKMETDVGLADIQSSFRKFLSWLRTFDLPEAQRLVNLFDDFIKTVIK